jgi:putative two-component system response regulator
MKDFDDNYSILIVDDIAQNIQIALDILKEDSSLELSYALSGKDAITLCQENQYDLILLDIMMPHIDGYEVCEHIKSLGSYKDVPVIFITAKNDIESIQKAFEVGGVDYITKPFFAKELLARVNTHLQLYKSKQILQDNNLSLKREINQQRKQFTKVIEERQRDVIFILAEVIESYSLETGYHIKRVAEISKQLAHYHSSLDIDDEKMIYYASAMHDIGKVAVPQHILSKPTSLDEEEFEIVKRHPAVGYEILHKSSNNLLQKASIIAYEHHERYDGSGYPRGLKGDEIDIYGRIVALADVFDAITHKRCYKEAWDMPKAIDYIIEQRGFHFDPYIVDIFLDNLNEFIEIAKK